MIGSIWPGCVWGTVIRDVLVSGGVYVRGAFPAATRDREPEAWTRATLSIHDVEVPCRAYGD